MEQYYKGLVGYLTTRLRDRNMAADVAHDAYVRVLESPRCNSLEHPKAFLYRTAINLCVDSFRRTAVRRSECLDEMASDSGLKVHGPHVTLYQLQRAELVQQALQQLPDNCRQAFLLRKLEGLGHDEIAQCMGISKAMVEKHIVNAMKHCRVHVSQVERVTTSARHPDLR